MYRLSGTRFILHSPFVLFDRISIALPILVTGIATLVLFLFPLNASAVLTLKGKLNINDATEGEFLLLPHIDSAIAESIYKYRQKGGDFENLHSLLSVEGIGRKTYEKILPYIKLDGESDLTISRIDNKNSLSLLYDPGESDKVLLLGNGDFFTTLLESVNKAQKSIYLSMFLFKISNYESNRANILLEAIASAAERGVNVFILLEESNRRNDTVTVENRKSAEKLRKRGAIVRFDSPKRTTHTKALVIDSRYVFIGSHNFTHSALRYNNELSLFIDSKTLAEKTLNYIKDIN